MQSPHPPIRVLCVDDHPLVRAGVLALISGSEDIELVGEAASGREAIEQFRVLKPDVTLMDLKMADMGGIDAVMSIRAEFREARIVVLTTYPGDALAQRALKAGAQAYLLKSQVRAELLDTIRAVHLGQRRVDLDVAQELARHAAGEQLSAREIEILELVAAGNSNKSIADKLSIAEGTVKSHIKNILAKLGARDRTHAVALASNRGITGF
ncbi:response regulator transcription factor [Variovorax sp. Sphag1AA]|uniref:response regulator n=1 Tax=Variovorax sp. Sphag1AA TaxID=2587027 RepID=UPI001610629E|nr:response regulator transcription factor [Variovorax sp. Sphag1AA]MBB3178793.1 DNA-binding NarL/FixJ family response regulator [Variovorax sp. Sphag1AA]